MNTKHIFSILILALIHLSVSAENKANNQNTNHERNSSSNVLVVGIPEDNLVSYYDDNNISDKLDIPKDSISYYLNNAIYEGMKRKINRFDFNVVLMKESDAQQKVYNNIKYDINKVKMNSEKAKVNTHNLNKATFQNLLDTYKSNYAVFISKIVLNYKGDNYNCDYYQIFYEIFDKNMKSVSKNHFSFVGNTSISLQKITRKLGRKEKYILKTVEDLAEKAQEKKQSSGSRASIQ